MVRQTSSVGINKGVLKEINDRIKAKELSFSSAKTFVDYYSRLGLKQEEKKLKRKKS